MIRATIHISGISIYTAEDSGIVALIIYRRSNVNVPLQNKFIKCLCDALPLKFDSVME